MMMMMPMDGDDGDDEADNEADNDEKQREVLRM